MAQKKLSAVKKNKLAPTRKVKPFFSVIIPALNEEKYLPHLLSDLSKQSFKDFEVILVDGQSDDQTVAKAKTYAKKLELTILTSARRHVCTQRNLGAQHAKAETLIFMDADNRLANYFLQGVKYRLESDFADIATCYLQSDTQKQTDKNFAKAINLAIEILKNSPSARVMESLVIMTKFAYESIQGFDESVDFAEGNDLLKTAFKKNLLFKVYRDPVYTHSFRRFRVFGHFNMVSRGAQIELIKLLGLPKFKSAIVKLYPMTGGTLFDKKHKLAISKKLTKLFDSLKQ